jgi:hypothetical protein
MKFDRSRPGGRREHGLPILTGACLTLIAAHPSPVADALPVQG